MSFLKLRRNWEISSRISTQIHMISEHVSNKIRLENELWSPQSGRYQFLTFSNSDLLSKWDVRLNYKLNSGAPEQIYTKYDHVSTEMQLENEMQSPKPGQVYIKYNQVSIQIELANKP